MRAAILGFFVGLLLFFCLVAFAKADDPHADLLAVSRQCANVCQSVILSQIHAVCPSADMIVDRFEQRRVGERFKVCRVRRDGSLGRCKSARVLVDYLRR